MCLPLSPRWGAMHRAAHEEISSVDPDRQQHSGEAARQDAAVIAANPGPPRAAHTLRAWYLDQCCQAGNRKAGSGAYHACGTGGHTRLLRRRGPETGRFATANCGRPGQAQPF